MLAHLIIRDPSQTASESVDEETAGIILVQGFLQYFCQGVICAQAVKFWKRSANDRLYLRLFVLTLVIGACIQTVFLSAKVWVVTLRGRHWWTSVLYPTDFLLNGLLCTLNQSYLIKRCWKLTQRNNYILIPQCILTFVAVVANIYLAVVTGISIGMTPAYSDPLRASDWAFPCWVYTTLVLDLTITTTLSYALWKSKTGIIHLDRVVDNIISVTWETAALPCIFMIISGALYFVGRKEPQVRHLDVFFILSAAKLYTLGLLRTLNSRKKFRKTMEGQKNIGRKSLGTWLQHDANNKVVADDIENNLQPAMVTSPTTVLVDDSSESSLSSIGSQSTVVHISPTLDPKEEGSI